MDGLLLDTERISAVAWEKAAEEMGETIDESVFLHLIGRNGRGIEMKLKELLGDHIDTAELTKRAIGHYDRLLENGPPIKPGAKRCLSYLASRAIPQAVATSSSLRYAKRKLGHHDLLDHLDDLVTGDQVTSGKPDPEPFLLAAQRLGMQPEHCLAFEDSVNGILAAYRAGMRPVLIPDIAVHDEASLSKVWKRYHSLDDAMELLESLFG